MYVYIYIYNFGSFWKCFSSDVTVVGDGWGCAASGKQRKSFPKPSRAQLKVVLKVFPGFCIPIHHQGRWEEAGKPWPAPCPQGCDLHRASMTPLGWMGQNFGVDFQKMGLSWQRRKILGVGCGKVFWKMASKFATAPKLTQPCVRNQRKELAPSSPSLGLWD